MSANQKYWLGEPAGYTSPIIYSGMDAAVIPASNASYVAWLAAGGTPLQWPRDSTSTTTTAALDAVLAAWGWPASGLTAATKPQLLAYANAKVETLLATARSYTVAGLSGPVVDDLGPATALTMNTTFVMQSGLSYPYSWSDDNYTIWSMTQAQLAAFLEAAFAYGNSVWALANGTAFPGINAGTITTEAQINALAWPV